MILHERFLDSLRYNTDVEPWDFGTKVSNSKAGSNRTKAQTAKRKHIRKNAKKSRKNNR